MAKFKVGDIVVANEYSNECYYFTNKINSCKGIVVKNYENGKFDLKIIEGCCLKGRTLELRCDCFDLEQPTVATKLKLDSDGVTITADACTIQSQLYKYATVTQLEKKEGNKMIESINLIDLYVNKKEEKIRKDAKEQIGKIRNESEIEKKFREILETAKKQLNELYLSQLSEEDKEKIKNGEEVDEEKYQFVRDGEIELDYDNCYINADFVNDEIKEINDNMSKQLKEVQDLAKLVKAHVGIAKTKEEVEEILERYGIIDKKTGKLVTE